MNERGASLRLRPMPALLLFISGYTPLIFILIVKDYDPECISILPRHPVLCGIFIIIACISCVVTLYTARNIKSGLTVEITKASNKSGEMFGYSVPYILSFVRIDLGDWQTLISLLVFMVMLFIIAYRTQTVFVNPILALAGYMLIDCTFRRDNVETQAMVITKKPLKPGDFCFIEQLSHYLYIAANQENNTGEQEKG